jgi:hypothetical protein
MASLVSVDRDPLSLVIRRRHLAWTAVRRLTPRSVTHAGQAGLAMLVAAVSWSGGDLGSRYLTARWGGRLAKKDMDGRGAADLMTTAQPGDMDPNLVNAGRRPGDGQRQPC